MKVEPRRLYIWSTLATVWRISNGYWLSFFRLILSCYLVYDFWAIRNMLGEQEGIHGVIYPFEHVVYSGEWSKIPQHRLSGSAAEDKCPWYSGDISRA